MTLPELDLGSRTDSPKSRPPASPVVVRTLGFLLALVILTMAPLIIPADPGFATESIGWGLLYMLVFHVPAAVSIWLFAVILSRTRQAPPALVLVATVTLALLAVFYILPFLIPYWAIAPALGLCLLGSVAIVFGWTGRFGRRPAPLPMREPPLTELSLRRPETDPDVERAPGPQAGPTWTPRREARVKGPLPAGRTVVIAILMTATQAFFQVSPLAFVGRGWHRLLGGGDVGPDLPQYWFGLLLLAVAVIFLDKHTVRQAPAAIGLDRPTRSWPVLLCLLAPTLPALYFGPFLGKGGPPTDWPPTLGTLGWLVTQGLFLEGFYRGYVLTRLARESRWPWWLAAVLSAALSSAGDLYNLFAIEPEWRFLWPGLATEAALGLFSALLFLLVKYDLYPSLVLRLISPFVFLAAFEGTSMARVILAGWGVVCLVIAALSGRRASRSPSPARLTQAPVSRRLASRGESDGGRPSLIPTEASSQGGRR